MPFDGASDSSHHAPFADAQRAIGFVVSWLPRADAARTVSSRGSNICWCIYCPFAGLNFTYSCSGQPSEKKISFDFGGASRYSLLRISPPNVKRFTYAKP